MRFKLVHKLLAVNIGIILVLTASLVSLSYYFSSGMFSGALNGIDREVMKHLSHKLGNYYDTHESWDGLIEDRSAWAESVDQSFYNVFFSLVERAGHSPVASFQGLEKTGNGFMPQDTGAWNMPFGTFLQRCALLDPEKQVLIPAEVSTERVSHEAIRHDGNIVAWLRVGKINVDVLPLAEYFFKQQMQIVYWSIIIGGFGAAFLSFILSRHLTAPIKQLIAGARLIGQRKFDTKIKVTSNDELQELAESFQSLADQLAEYTQQQRQWLSHISHELKAPLTVLVGEVYAVCDNLSSCDETTVATLQQEVDYVKRLADDLFEVCKLDEVGYHYQMAETDIQGVLQSQVRHYQNRFDKNKIRVDCSLLPKPVIVLGDSDRLGQVFCNLFENCIRHAGTPGSLKIAVTEDSGAAIITLADSGAGVAPEDVGKLFDRFYSQGTTVAGKPLGAGLGLAICKEIVERHRGTIEATNDVNGGLCIIINLPSVTSEEPTST